jgi:pimeloyl-ACP methyl ester carboxylesterase
MGARISLSSTTMIRNHRLVLRTIVPLLFVSFWLAGTANADVIVDGRTGPGSVYRLYLPTNWNGRLVVYVHGFVASEAPVSLPDEADLIISLVGPQGFAVAFSSFSSNGWEVKDGAQRSHQLLGIFTSKFGLPSRVYLGGTSMGGLIAIKLAETYPGLYSGVVAACAAVGGTRRQFDYLGNTRALFDFFYPGALPGDAAHVSADVDVTQDILAPAIAAIGANPVNTLALATITQTPLPFANGTELGESLLTALVGHAGTFNDLIARTHGHPYFDNRMTEYTGAISPPVLAAINAGVERFDASPDALRYLDNYYEPSGDLSVPTIMLSTSRDPVLPAFHQIAYTNAVAASGSADLLVHRIVDRYGHCNFTPTELATAFADIVRWAELGIKPTP